MSTPSNDPIRQQILPAVIFMEALLTHRVEAIILASSVANAVRFMHNLLYTHRRLIGDTTKVTATEATFANGSHIKICYANDPRSFIGGGTVDILLIDANASDRADWYGIFAFMSSHGEKPVVYAYDRDEIYIIDLSAFAKERMHATDQPKDWQKFLMGVGLANPADNKEKEELRALQKGEPEKESEARVNAFLKKLETKTDE